MRSLSLISIFLSLIFTSNIVYAGTIEEINMLSKYNKWIDEVNKRCYGQQDEDAFFQKIFEDTSKYCLV